MKRRLTIISLTILLTTLILMAVFTLKQVNRLISDMDATVLNLNQRITDTSQNTNAALIQIGLVTNEARRASIEQRQYWRKTSIETERTVKSLRKLIETTNIQLNDSALPRLSADADRITESSIKALDGLQPPLEELNRTLLSLNTQVSNPAIGESLQNIQTSTKNLAAATTDIQAKVHDLTRPASLSKRIVLGALDVMTKVGSMVGGLF